MRGSRRFVPQRRKWEVPEDPFEVEEKRMFATPDTGYLHSAINELAEELVLNADVQQPNGHMADAQRNAAAAIVAQNNALSLGEKAKQRYLREFWKWLAGKSTNERIIERTPWGRQPCFDDDEVRAYLGAFLRKRREFQLKLELLKSRPLRGIDQHWLFFKYIAATPERSAEETERLQRNDLDPDQFFDYLGDWEFFVRAFDNNRDQEAMDPEHRMWPRPYGDRDPNFYGPGIDPPADGGLDDASDPLVPDGSSSSSSSSSDAPPPPAPELAVVVNDRETTGAAADRLLADERAAIHRGLGAGDSYATEMKRFLKPSAGGGGPQVAITPANLDELEAVARKYPQQMAWLAPTIARAREQWASSSSSSSNEVAIFPESALKTAAKNLAAYAPKDSFMDALVGLEGTDAEAQAGVDRLTELMFDPEHADEGLDAKIAEVDRLIASQRNRMAIGESGNALVPLRQLRQQLEGAQSPADASVGSEYEQSEGGSPIKVAAMTPAYVIGLFDSSSASVGAVAQQLSFASSGSSSADSFIGFLHPVSSSSDQPESSSDDSMPAPSGLNVASSEAPPPPSRPPPPVTPEMLQALAGRSASLSALADSLVEGDGDSSSSSVVAVQQAADAAAVDLDVAVRVRVAQAEVEQAERLVRMVRRMPNSPARLEGLAEAVARVSAARNNVRRVSLGGHETVQVLEAAIDSSSTTEEASTFVDNSSSFEVSRADIASESVSGEMGSDDTASLVSREAGEAEDWSEAGEDAEMLTSENQSSELPREVHVLQAQKDDPYGNAKNVRSLHDLSIWTVPGLKKVARAVQAKETGGRAQLEGAILARIAHKIRKGELPLRPRTRIEWRAEIPDVIQKVNDSATFSSDEDETEGSAGEEYSAGSSDLNSAALDKMDNKGLKATAKARGLKVGGKAAELKARIKAANNQSPEQRVRRHLKAKGGKWLTAQLKAIQQPHSGKIDDKINRLLNQMSPQQLLALAKATE